MKRNYLLFLLLEGLFFVFLPSTLRAQTESSITISGMENSLSSNVPMDFRMATSRSQMYYPASVLNLPKGTLIKSISFSYDDSNVFNWGTGGDVRVSLGEIAQDPIPENVKNYNENLTLVYEGSHLIGQGKSEVTYTFTAPYAYQGGCLFIDVSNMDSPREGFEGYLSFYGCVDLVNTMSCFQDYYGDFQTSPEVPTLQIGYQLPANSPQLYLPFAKRSVDFGFVNVGKASILPIRISNKGNVLLKTDPIQTSIISAPSIEIPANSEMDLPVSMHVQSDGSFKEQVHLKSNGGSCDLTFLGTTYRLPQANTVAKVNAGIRLSACNLSSEITDLSVVGEMTKEDWKYISSYFTHLKKLDLSQAVFEDTEFPNVYRQDAMACSKTLERISFPNNVERLSQYFFELTKLKYIKEVILPFNFQYLDSDFTGCECLHRLISLAPIPPGVYNSISHFSEIYVPANCKQQYSEASTWNRMNLLALTPGVLNDEINGDITLDLRGRGSIDPEGNFLIDYQVKANHTQAVYTKESLKISKGTKINSITLSLYLADASQLPVNNGRMTIACREYEGAKTDDRLFPVSQVNYTGSDHLNVTNPSLDETQTVTYEFTTPYVYQGGNLVIDFKSERETPMAKGFRLGGIYNSIVGNFSLVEQSSGQTSRSNYSPSIVLGVNLAPNTPVPFIPVENRKINCGYAPITSLSAGQLIKIENKGTADFTVNSLTANQFALVQPVTIPANSTGAVSFAFIPKGGGSYMEEANLETSVGTIKLKLRGTTYRHAPYWKKELTVRPGQKMRDLFGNQPDTITALSIRGFFTNQQWREFAQLRSLRKLDLSTARIESDYFRKEKFVVKLEEFALPVNLETVDLADATSLKKLILPVGVEKIKSLPSQLTELISLAAKPPFVQPIVVKNVETVYVPENMVEIYKKDASVWSKKNILPITDEMLGGRYEPSTILIENNEVYDIYGYPIGVGNIKISPNVLFNEHASLINKAPMPLQTLTLVNCFKGRYLNYDGDINSLFNEDNVFSSFVNESELATCNIVSYEFQVYPNNWYFCSFPFDVNLSEIQSDEGISYVFRYYDGAARAKMGMDAWGSNWKNADGWLEAGKGYILQTDYPMNAEYNTLRFATLQTGSILSTQKKFKDLEEYISVEPDNESWNFVGNPYPSFFNIHHIEYCAPIIIHDGTSYVALSLTDDDYALRPYEAFFVQKPRGASSRMYFNPEGRQVSPNVIRSIQTRAGTASSRWLINLNLVGEKYVDRSRIVINPEAKLSYEMTCDAPKWMSSRKDIPQLYSLGEGKICYAINERPEGNGVIPLGVYVGEEGNYTLKIPKIDRCQSVILYDKYTGQSMDLSTDEYKFYSEKGTFDDRFEIRLGNVTSVDRIEKDNVRIRTDKGRLHLSATAGENVKIYAVSGVLLMNENMRTDTWTISMPAGLYLVQVGRYTQKVMIY